MRLGDEASAEQCDNWTIGIKPPQVRSINANRAKRRNFPEEVHQAINDLGLQAKLNVKFEQIGHSV
jgi:hypothetical protein